MMYVAENHYANHYAQYYANIECTGALCTLRKRDSVMQAVPCMQMCTEDIGTCTGRTRLCGQHEAT
jgi:hypothetical protein